MTNEIVLYKPNDQLSLEVKLENETVWLSQQQMVILFDSTKQNILLSKISVCTLTIFSKKEN